MSPDETTIVLIDYLALFLFGVLYNAFIGWAEHRATKSKGLWQFIDGTTSLQVVIGVLVTLAGLYVIDHLISVEGRVFGLSLGAFSASGAPMVAGSLRRYSRHLSDMFKRRVSQDQTK